MNRYNLIFLIIFFTFILPGPPAAPITSEEQYSKLLKFKSHLYQSYTHLQNSTFQHSFGNLTGFQLSYQDALNGELNQTYPLPDKDYTHWENNQNYSILPDEITQRGKEIWDLDITQIDGLNYYTNISSTVSGAFSLKNNTFQQLPLHLPTYLEHFDEDINRPSTERPFNTPNISLSEKVGNITDSNGLISLEIITQDTLRRKHFNELDEKVKFININFEISNEDEDNKQTVETEGFYFVESGNIITSTNSAKFFSLYGGLQHLTFDQDHFDWSKNLTLNYLDNSLFRFNNIQENSDINLNYLTHYLEKSETRCEYISYFHVNKVNLTKQEIENIDKELTNPIGRPIDIESIPELNLTGFLYSPDCALEITVPEITGLKDEVRLFKIHKVVTAGTFILFAQLLLLMKQMNYSSTPSTISRISFWSICMMSLVDGSLSLIYLVGSAILNKLYLPLTVSAFLSFILASIFEMRFMISIYVAQMNERSLNLFTALQGRPLDSEDGDTNGNGNGTDGAQPTQTTPTNEPQDESQVSGTIYTRFFFTLIVFTFVMLNSMVWPKHVRTLFEDAVIFILNSYWLPQVYRNVIKGSHRSFKWWFIIGTSLVRVIPIFYIFVVKTNVFRHHYSPKYFISIVLWLAFQIFLLFLQEIFGARFFLPKRLLPQTYNYHPVLTESDLESGFGIEHSHVIPQEDSDNNTPVLKNLDNGQCSIDCAICMATVDLPILKSNLDQAATFLQRRNYMVTPCRHIFHTQCLEAWMKYKLQCPVCRNSLPPL